MYLCEIRGSKNADKVGRGVVQTGGGGLQERGLDLGVDGGAPRSHGQEGRGTHGETHVEHLPEAGLAQDHVD